MRVYQRVNIIEYIIRYHVPFIDQLIFIPSGNQVKISCRLFIMSKVEIHVSILKVSIALKFPSKLQIGFRINQSEVLTEQIVESKSAEVEFGGVLVNTIEVGEEMEQGLHRKIQIRKEDGVGRLVLYMVLGKRKITAGFISINLNEVLSQGSEVTRITESWERCSDKNAYATIEIRRVERGGHLGLEPIIEEEKESNDLSESKEMKTEVEHSMYLKSSHNQPANQVPVRQELQLTIPILQKEKLRKYSEGSAKRMRTESMDKELETKGLEISTIDMVSPEIRPKAFSNSNFLSQEDQEYVKSLKIHVYDQGNSSDQIELNQSLPTPLMFKKTLPKLLLDLSSLQDSPRQQKQQNLTSRSRSILKKKLQLTQQYCNKQLQRYGRDLFKMQQKCQKLSVQLQIKDDQIKWMHEELLINDEKIHDLEMKEKESRELSSEPSLIALKQLVDKMESERLEQEVRVETLRQELRNERQLRLNWEKEVQRYQEQSGTDKQIIATLKQQLQDTQRNIIHPISQTPQQPLPQTSSLLDTIHTLQHQLSQQTQFITQCQQQIQYLSSKLTQTKQQLKQATQQLITKEKNHILDQQNIREFQKELTDKYKLIYSLEGSLKDEKEKSRELSRSIEGKNAIGKLMEFSFNKQCNHNFVPLYNKVKEILSAISKTKLEIVKSMNLEEKDHNEIKIVKQYGYLQTLSRNFALALQESFEPEEKDILEESLKVDQES